MRIICAPDSFKDSLTAREAAAALARGVLRVFPDAEVVQLPIADGGEGTGEALAVALGGEIVEAACHDALGRPVTGRIAVIAGHGAEQRGIAVLEVAAACGIERLTAAERDATITTTHGVGELIRAALDRGARTLYIGLGGTATNDAGAGMLTALGARLLDAAGRELPAGGAALAHLAQIDASGLDPRLADARFILACDVDNPLLGASGASAVFGPQKGANAEDVATLDAALTRWADVVETATGRAVRDVPGAGAAGGIGTALLAYCAAELRPGADMVLDAINITAALAGADLVLTGEGSFDRQSLAGKAPVALAARAHAAGIPTVLFAGRVDPELDAQLPPGVVAAIPITSAPATLHEALAAGAANLERAAATVCRLWQPANAVTNSAANPTV